MNKQLIELKKKTDLELLELYTGQPKSDEGLSAETLLRYRQYLVSKQYNTLIIILTIVLAISAAIEAWSVRQANIATHARESSRNTADLMPAAHEISSELEKINEALKRIQSNYSNSNQNVGHERAAPQR